MLNIKIDHKPSKANLQDIVGTNIGRWEVIKYAFAKNHKHFYYCKCECGVTKDVDRCNLITGVSKSCGCLQSEISSAYMKGKVHPSKTTPAERNEIKSSNKKAKELAKDYGVSIYTIYSIRKEGHKFSN